MTPASLPSSPARRRRFASRFCFAASALIALPLQAQTPPAEPAHVHGPECDYVEPTPTEPLGVVRFLPPGMDPASVVPIAVLLKIKALPIDNLPDDHSGHVPAFTRSDAGFSASFDIDPGTTLHGVGSAPGHLNRAGQIFNLNAHDADDLADHAPAHTRGSPHPFLLAVRADGAAFAIILESLDPGQIDLSAVSPDASKPGKIAFRNFPSPFSLVVVEGASPQDVLTKYAEISGRPMLLPRKALGFSQHADAKSDADLRSFASLIRQQRFPCDALWFGIDSSARGKAFSVSQSIPSDARALTAELAAKGFSSFLSLSTAVTNEPGYWVRDQLVNSRYTIMSSSDSTASPARSKFDQNELLAPDFSRPKVRQWWAGLHKDLTSAGFSGFAIDSILLPLDPDSSLEGGDWHQSAQIPASTWDRARNLYPLLASQATFEGVMAARRSFRPFVLSRHAWPGSQRTSAPFVSDRRATSQDLVNQVLSLGLSGQPLVCADVALMRDRSLPQRLALGALMGLVRGSSAPQPSYALDDSHESAVKYAVEQRYRLMPYLVKTAEEASSAGLPMVRPLFFADPANPALRNESRAFLLGQDIAVVLDDSHADQILPQSRGSWQRINPVPSFPDLHLPALYLRPGAIVPIAPVLQTVDQKHNGPIALLINFDSDAQALGSTYDDDQDNHDYTVGKYRSVTYLASRSKNRVEIKPVETAGDYPQTVRDYTAMIFDNGFYTSVRGVASMSLTMDLSRLAPVKMDGAVLPGADPLPPASPSSTYP